MVNTSALTGVALTVHAVSPSRAVILMRALIELRLTFPAENDGFSKLREVIDVRSMCLPVLSPGSLLGNEASLARLLRSAPFLDDATGYTLGPNNLQRLAFAFANSSSFLRPGSSQPE
jgi:hypothetical protein